MPIITFAIKYIMLDAKFAGSCFLKLFFFIAYFLSPQLNEISNWLHINFYNTTRMWKFRNLFLYTLIASADIPVYLLRGDTITAAAALFISGDPLVPDQGAQILFTDPQDIGGFFCQKQFFFHLFTGLAPLENELSNGVNAV